MADDRRRTWAAIIYPESLPDDWKERLENTRVPVAVSPLHDQDIIKETGELKKPHYHIVFYFESLKTSKQVLALLALNGLESVKHVEPVESTRAYNRYLAHMDQPNKAQYNPDDITRLNGAVCDVSKQMPTADEQRIIRAEIIKTIRQYNMTDYCELVDYADDSGLEEWAWFISTHTIYLENYLKSRRCRFGRA